MKIWIRVLLLLCFVGQPLAQAADAAIISLEMTDESPLSHDQSEDCDEKEKESEDEQKDESISPGFSRFESLKLMLTRWFSLSLYQSPFLYRHIRPPRV